MNPSDILAAIADDVAEGAVLCANDEQWPLFDALSSLAERIRERAMIQAAEEARRRTEPTPLTSGSGT